MTKFIIVMAIFSIALGACSGKPKVEESAPAEAPQGVTDDDLSVGVKTSAPPPETTTKPTIIGEAAEADKPAKITIKGSVMTGAGRPDIPVKNVKLLMVSAEGRIILESKTDSSGNFSITGNFANGGYRIKIMSPQFRGDAKFQVSGSDINDLLVTARPPNEK